MAFSTTCAVEKKESRYRSSSLERLISTIHQDSVLPLAPSRGSKTDRQAGKAPAYMQVFRPHNGPSQGFEGHVSKLW